MGYITGHNMAGYLPDSDEPPYVHETFEDAKHALIEDMLWHADQYDNVDEPEHAEELSSAAEDVNLWGEKDGEGWLIYVDYRSGYMAYWIEQVEEEEGENDG